MSQEELRTPKGKVTDIMNRELEAFFGNREDNKKPWKTEQWRSQREEVISDACEWCGSPDDLSLHHTNERRINWRWKWVQIERSLFEDSDRFEESLLEGTEICPNCNYASIYTRKTIEPEYKCSKCKHEFETPETKYTHRSDKTDEYYSELLEWLDGNLAQVRQQFEEFYENYWEHYFDLSNDSVVTICRTCHYNWHENRMRPCEMCENGYGKRRPEVGKYLCWEHFAEAKGLKQCACGSNWFNPEYNNECKSCRSGSYPF